MATVYVLLTAFDIFYESFFFYIDNVEESIKQHECFIFTFFLLLCQIIDCQILTRTGAKKPKKFN